MTGKEGRPATPGPAPGPEEAVRDGLGEAPLTVGQAVRSAEAVLDDVLDAGLRRARQTDPVYARDVVCRVTAFARRGGKRLRTAFAWCGWQAAGGSGDALPVLRTGAALELLQVCALVHDDVMDGSLMRRGGPAMHVDFARQFPAGRTTGSPDSFGRSAAVLAGDLALAWADDLLTETALGSVHGTRLYQEWRATRGEMVAGQYRDIHAQAAGVSGLDEAVAIATLKSARYTVERPLALGATLAGADEHTLDALRSAGRSAGLAFQLRDDLLGAFGDPVLTGKPAGEDLRTRKLTYLLAVALTLAEDSGDADAAAVLAPGGGNRSARTVERMRSALVRTGACSAVEAKIADLVVTSLRHFARTGASPQVRREFAALVERAAGPAPRLSEEKR
ncbi:polyprenyl synthetase family protein [Streptomyces sp. NPDC001743]|uniref:polyprenyl synthetase family protein n=1 Tax=Streptomyces sp. NPDC001743 TaxID=3154397 RepID=UPI00332BF9B5